MRRSLSFLASLAVLGGSIASAADPLKTSWGELRPQLEQAGTYSVAVTNRPADGKLLMPEAIEPIVLARYFDVEARKLAVLPLDYDAASGQLTVTLPEGVGNSEGFGFSLHAAKGVTQSPEGAIDFPAQAARVVGEAARLESNGSHHRIGFWTNPADYVAWDYSATRWGRYRVLLTYSTASPDGGVAEIEMGGAKLDVELPSTGSWYSYRTIDAGDLYLATDGKHELIVRAKSLSGAALMNLKAVRLEPTYESDEIPTQADDGTVTLHAKDARVSGTKLRYEPKPEKNTLGYWTNATDRAMWRFEIREPGTFDVEILQGCGTGQGGTTMDVYGRMGSRNNVSFVVEETGHFQNFVPRVVGRMTFAQAGDVRIVVAPHEKIAKAAACDIRQIRLIPVKPE